MSSPNETLLNNRYRLVSQLASGGMAVVYKAIDESLGRTVAVKILRPSLTKEQAFVARFQNEARSIANLSHPNIVTVHDVGSDPPTYYIVMELVDGSDLKKVIRTHGALPLDRALRLAIQVCDGIGYAHRAGIVHADIKPQNVLLTRADVVKITDFGIAQALSDTQPAERASVVWGSPHYFAPEQAQGEKPSSASDVYSIGVVLFEMLTGRLPFTGASQQDLAMAHVQTTAPSVKEFNPQVPDEIANVVRKVLKKNPNDRFRFAHQLGSVLKSYLDRLDQGKPLASVASPPPFNPEDEESRPMPPPVASSPPSSAPPTQPYNVVPEAPQPAAPRQQAGPPPPPPASQQHPRAFTMSPRSSPQGDSRPFAAPYDPSLRDEEPRFEWDGVTIALAVLAFLAVAGLIPLYLVAFSAQFG